MLSFHRYPLLYIFIPLLCGMFLSTYIYDVVKFDNYLSLIVISVVSLIVGLGYFYCLKKKLDTPLRTISQNLIFLILGLIITSHSIHSAQKEYGDKWRYSIYDNNSFKLSAAHHVQQSISHAFRSHGITGDEGALIEAITIGEKSNISKDIKTDFSRSGISHILALSGFHISVIYIILQIVFLSRLIIYPWNWISQVLTIIVLWAYAFVSGMPPSLARAIIMCTILIIGKLHTNEIISLNGLAFSALVMLLINPLLIFHVGFQLSYISMLAIYLVGIPLINLYDSYTFVDKFIYSTVCITFACTLFTLPIVSHTFGTIALMSVFTNIIATTLTYLLYAVLSIWLITFAWSPITHLLLSTSGSILSIAKFISHLPHSTINHTFSLPEITLYYSLLAIILILCKYIPKPAEREQV